MARQDHVVRQAHAVFYVVCAIFAAISFAVPAQAAAPTAVGLWRTIDDKTHAPKSIVETYLRDGKLCGRVKQVLQSDNGPNPRCERCTGAQHNAPVEGLEIMWDLAEDGGNWEKGSVLDPANGTVYRCRVRLAGPDKLEVRGFMGISLFGRTQVWERVPAVEQATPTL